MDLLTENKQIGFLSSEKGGCMHQIRAPCTAKRDNHHMKTAEGCT